MSEPVLPFTGERFTPECVREMWYEHWHRYALAAQAANGRRVLDAACGEGYGSALLAQRAREVVGIDLSADAVAHARSRYGQLANLRFEVGDVSALPARLGRFDLISSFETLEHVDADAQQQMLAGFATLLADDGVLLLSSPDKATYSDATGYQNPFHAHELYLPELRALLAQHFPAVEILGQQLAFVSVLAPVDRAPERWSASAVEARTALKDGLAGAPMYYLAACAHRPEVLEAWRGRLDLFADVEQSVYAHYYAEIRKGIHLAGVVDALRAEIAALKAELGR
ncbi:MAG: methyltransferase domain-containing protein [Xanthomonadales bacterium]|jgi:SAM-dependent methyltransferase|nr:methyltransferase domain-containing protein [Xanthomonadales bacterium]